mgnify:CR=1 FL=1
MRPWRNWYTRTFEGRVQQWVRVQVPSVAPNSFGLLANRILFADMAELVDALDSGSSGFTALQVQVLLSAPCRVFL